MRRRTLIQSLIAWISLRSSRLRAQLPSFPGSHEATLKDLAATVLPEQLGRAGAEAVALQFVRWVGEYRAGAEMQTGYGTTRVRYKPPSPAPRYLEQLAALSSGALAMQNIAARREALTAVLKSQKIDDLPMSPNGGHIATDLMAFYFFSPEANDLAYRAAIGKDQCRTLRNSGHEPSPLRKGAGLGSI